MRRPARGGAEVHGRAAYGARVRRPPAQGLLARGHRVQGVRLLPDRQPRQGAVWRIVIILVLGLEGKRVEGERGEGVEGEELVFFLVRFRFVFVFVFVEVGRRLVVLVRQLRVVILGQFFRREGRLTAMTATAPEDAPPKPRADIGDTGGGRVSQLQK